MPKKRKKRNTPSGPPKSVKDFARNYRCSHCNSQVASVIKTPAGAYQVNVSHDDSCPVLRGTLTDARDVVRAAIASGRIAAVLTPASPGGGDR